MNAMDQWTTTESNLTLILWEDLSAHCVLELIQNEKNTNQRM